MSDILYSAQHLISRVARRFALESSLAGITFRQAGAGPNSRSFVENATAFYNGWNVKRLSHLGREVLFPVMTSVKFVYLY